MALHGTFTYPFYRSAASVSSAVPHRFSVALAGHVWVLDTKKEWGRSSIKLLRDQADSGDRPGERSINPDDRWRRTTQSWHFGAGQEWADRETSHPHRFNTSKGVNPWTEWEASLLPDVERKRESTSSNVRLARAGGYLYAADDQALLHTQDVTTPAPTFVPVTGTPVADIGELASDGLNVWAAFAANGLWSTTRGAAAATQYVTGTDTFTAVDYVKGRLMVAVGSAIHNIVAAGAALPAALTVAAMIPSDFTWVGFAEGHRHIYAAGFSGDKSLIVRTAVKDDGTGLDVAIVAASLPDGEVVSAIGSYLGLVLIGSETGVWVAQADANGDLVLNRVLDTPAPVRCFEGQGRFVWFGWSNYDATSTGLGRMDLSVNTKEREVVTPAYASDLMATAQGTVLSVVTFQDRRVFSVASSGVWVESTELVATAEINSGRLGFDLPDEKVSTSVDARFDTLVGAIEALLSVDGGTFDSLGTTSGSGLTSWTYPSGESRGQHFEIRYRLTRSAADATAAPVLSRSTLFAYPAPARRGRWVLPLQIRQSVKPPRGAVFAMKPREELEFIVGLVDSARPVSLQIGPQSFSVQVEEYDWIPEQELDDGSGWEGVCVVTVKMLASP